jgi:hypothetical protein
MPAPRARLDGARSWFVTFAAMAASTYALDAVATAAGLLLAASTLLHGVSHGLLLVVLCASYFAWGAALRVSLAANRRLLEATGTSTNALSKAGYDLARSRRAKTVAAAVGYVVCELAKEAPYYMGAFGATVLSDSVSSSDALVFLSGANLGAAAYEYALARLTRALLRRRSQHRRPQAGMIRTPGPAAHGPHSVRTEVRVDDARAHQPRHAGHA